MFTATVERGIKKHDQAKVDKYIRQQVKAYTKLRNKGHRDWKDMTDEQIQATAEFMARTYNVGEIFEWVSCETPSDETYGLGYMQGRGAS